MHHHPYQSVQRKQQNGGSGQSHLPGLSTGEGDCLWMCGQLVMGFGAPSVPLSFTSSAVPPLYLRQLQDHECLKTIISLFRFETSSWLAYITALVLTVRLSNDQNKLYFLLE